MNSICPKKSIAATFFYLENLRKEGVFNASEKNVDYILKKLDDIFNGYKENVKKYQKNSEFTVGNSLNFNLITKSTLSSVNFENTAEKTISLNKKQLLVTKYDIEMDDFEKIEIDNDKPFDYGKNYSIAIPDIEENQLYTIVPSMNININLVKILMSDIELDDVIEEAMDNQDFAMLHAANSRYETRMGIETKAIEKEMTKVDTGAIKINNAPVNEVVITFTPEMLDNFIKDNKNYVRVFGAGLSRENQDKITSVVSDIILKKIKENIIERINNGTLDYYAKSTNNIFLNSIFDNEKIDKKVLNLLTIYGNQNIAEINSIAKDSDEYSITLKVKPNSNTIISTIYTEGKGEEKQSLVTTANLFYQEINENDFSFYDEKSLLIEELEINIEASSRVNFKINKLSEKSEPPLYTIQSENLSKSYFYGKDIAKDFKNVCIDEADKGVSGKGVNIYYSIAKEAKNVVVGTGTATEGYASGIVPMLAYSGNFSPEDIVKNTEEFKTLCDKWKVKDEFLIQIISASSIHKGINDAVKSSILDFINNKESSDGFKTSKYAEEKAKYLLNLLAEKMQNKMDIFAKFDLSQISRSLSGVYEASHKMFKDKNSSIDLQQDANGILLRIMFENRKFLKRYPGIANVSTYASQIGSFNDTINTSIGTRETILKRKETMNMHDLATYNHTNIDTNKQKGMSIDDVFETNRTGVLIASRVLKDYSTANMIPQVKNFLAVNFDNFLDSLNSPKLSSSSISNNKHIILEEVKIRTGDNELEFKDIINSISKSTTQSPDDAKTLYRQALSLDFNQSYFEDVLKLNNVNLTDEVRGIREKKLSIFKALVETYRDSFLNTTNLKGLESDTSSDSIILSSDFGSFAMTEVSIPKFIKVEDSKIITINPSELKYSVSTIPEDIKNSINISLFKEDRWAEFTDNKIEYTYKYGNEREEEVLDIFGSRELENISDKVINSGQNPIIASSRIIGMISSAYDTIASAIRRENKEKPFVMIVNVSDKYARDMIKGINEDVLSQNNIEIVPVTRTMLDSTIRQYAKKDVQMSINSNYESISRGLDLSMQDTIIAAGAFTNGRELIQFLSRLYSVEKTTANIYMFNGGEDVSYLALEESTENNINNIHEILSTKKEDEMDLLSEHFEKMTLTTSYSNKLNERGYEKMITNQKFMGGSQVDVFFKSTAIVEFSDNYKNLEIKNEEIQNEISVNR